MEIRIDKKKCCWKNGKCSSCSCGGGNGGACIGCVEACSVGALKRGKYVIINKSKCIQCGACVSACKHKAISLN